jgi:glycosyltransferase involved in cell wall biosynthesis
MVLTLNLHEKRIRRMISIVSVYDDAQTLKDYLFRGLERQTVGYEIITVDNRDNRYKSAAQALNYGAREANGRYIAFLHQDIEIISPSFLYDVERILDRLPDLGVLGGAGMSKNGRDYGERARGFKMDRGLQRAGDLREPEEVQTLDEAILIVPNSVFRKIQFDEKTFDGWHCYGADYCLSVGQLGLRSYAITMPLRHRSRGTNTQNMFRFQKRLYNKHRKNYRDIYLTTSGERLSRLNFLRALLNESYAKVFPPWTSVVEKDLEKEISKSDTLLELGCSVFDIRWKQSYSCGVEPDDVYLDEHKNRRIHNEYIRADIRKVHFKQRSWDAVIALDVFGRLTKGEGYELIENMEYWSRKMIAICTPNGHVWPDSYPYDYGAPRRYVSGWTATELKRLGFRVIGIDGWKRLRQPDSSIKYKPEVVWQMISDVTQKIIRYYPKLASKLLAVKTVD